MLITKKQGILISMAITLVFCALAVVMHQNAQIKEQLHEKNKVEEKDVSTTSENTFKLVEKNETEKKEIMNTLIKNSSLIRNVFCPLPYEKVREFEEVENRLKSIRDYTRLKSSEDKNSMKGLVKYEETPYESSYVWIKKDYLKIQSIEFFDLALLNEDFEKERDDGEYYNTYMVPDGGIIDFYPVLNKIEYNEEKDIYRIYILDYKTIESDLKNYKNQYEITDEYLKENKLENKAAYIILDYQKRDNKNYLKKSERVGELSYYIYTGQ